MAHRVITRYEIRTEKSVVPQKIALVCDLHGKKYDDVLETLRGCDLIFIGGDLISGRESKESGLAFLRDAVDLAPTYYAPGNHEMYLGKNEMYAYLRSAKATGATVLDNAFVIRDGFVIGGLSERANLPMLRKFSQQAGYKILLCHRPEYYARYVAGLDIDLTLSGHAHGGQIRLFGQGLYAPGQGILPRLTRGMYENGRLIVSSGMANTVPVPRLFNPRELVVLDIASLEREAKGKA